MGIPRHALAVRMKVLSNGPPSSEVKQQIANPRIAMGTDVLVTLVLGIVFVMTGKPALGGTLLAMTIALLLGLALNLPNLSSVRRGNEKMGATER